MMKKRKGFSLAEVLVSLMIVGVVSAATIPTVTKQSTGQDKLWDWSDYPVGSIYYTGSHVLLDSDITSPALPNMAIESDKFGQNYFLAAKNELETSLKTLSANVFVPSNDKMIIYNNQQDFKIQDGEIVENSDIQKSFLSFYNILDRSIAAPYEYAGRLGADNTNLALGIGGLQYLVPSGTNQGRYNTAIGHYTLFTNIIGSDNTAVGRYAMPVFNGEDSAVRSFNVAVGNRSQLNNMYGRNNTSVGYNSLTAIKGNTSLSRGNFNIALGANALSTVSPAGDLTNEYYSRNIGIGADAGWEGATKPGSTNAKVFPKENLGSRSTKSYRLFIGDDAIQPLEAKIWHDDDNHDIIYDTEFNMNADEIVVNTADGTHTILKIRMVDDGGVSLPVYKEDGLTVQTTNYCAGEGSQDINNKVLADVCIAKFKDAKRVLPTYQEYKGIFKNETEEYTDWDIFMSSLDVGFDKGVMTGGNSHAHIRTVKSAINYIEMHKEGQGILSSAVDALVQNLKCFLTYFTGASSCDNLDSGYQRNFVRELKDWVKSIISKLEERVCDSFLTRWACAIFSDERLKDVSSVSTAGLEEINALKIKNYTYKADKNKTPHVGVIAQELQKVFPNSVVEGSDGYLRIKQEEMFYAMINSIKELDEQDKELQNEIPKTNKQINVAVQQNKALVDKNEKLKAENEKLNAQLKLLEAKQ